MKQYIATLILQFAMWLIRKYQAQPVTELCVLCGASGVHNIAGVGLSPSGNMQANPVCHACWIDPRHRRVQMKLHFFPKDRVASAVKRAGSGTLG